MYACIYECTYVCMCPESTSMLLYTYLMSLNKYGCHIANMSHIVIMVNSYIDPIFLDIYTKTQPTAISTLYVIAMYVPATNMSLNKAYIQGSICGCMTQLCQYKYLVGTHCDQQCDQKQEYMYILHYWHVSLGKNA